MFLTNWLDFTETINPLALMASESIAHLASSLMGYWLGAIRAQGIIVNLLFDTRVNTYNALVMPYFNKLLL